HVRLQHLGPRALVALEAELHVVRGHGVAVVELEPGPQLELVGLAVGTLLPRLREARTHLVAGIRADEGVVDRVEHAEGRDAGGRRAGARRTSAGSRRAGRGGGGGAAPGGPPRGRAGGGGGPRRTPPREGWSNARES